MRILVAIPVFNEEKYAAGVLARVLEHARDVLVVDDGSTDGTPGIVRRFPVAMLRHERNRGYGRSLIDAFAYAAREGYDWIITMDCDEQHEPAAIPAFLAEIARGGADIISGSRYLLPSPADDLPPPDRRKINQTITREINQALGLALTDSFCGFKAHRVSTLEPLGLTEEGYAFPMQLWARAAANGLRVREVPVKRIYQDTTRTFGGGLDDAERRLAHYRDVLAREARPAEAGACGALYCCL
jgi:dolichol-phosphate mannosyltransferase